MAGKNGRFWRKAAVDGHVRWREDTVAKVESCTVKIFSETLKREAIDDSDNLSRATEVAYEFCARR